MDDKEIIDLYWARAETAISATDVKYGRYCRHIAYNILQSEEDVEECVNDAYLRAWNVMPPQRPDKLSAFLGKLTRNLALDRYRYNNRDKRGCGQLPLALDELAECAAARGSTDDIAERMALAELLNHFLASLPDQTRNMFMRRYWFFSPVKEIAADFSVSESAVKMTMLRARKELKKLLMKEETAQ